MQQSVHESSLSRQPIIAYIGIYAVREVKSLLDHIMPVRVNLRNVVSNNTSSRFSYCIHVEYLFNVFLKRCNIYIWRFISLVKTLAKGWPLRDTLQSQIIAQKRQDISTQTTAKGMGKVQSAVNRSQ
jgi:hypothetical protein